MSQRKRRRGARCPLKTCEPCARKDHKTTKTSKKNCGANCLCVYGLGEQIRNAANPVWGEAKGLLAVLGDDPNDNVRSDVPAGLRNLGATCYLGSLVQVLYHNAAFRDALYRTPTAQRSDAEETVVSALQKIFADLEIGERSSCDVNILTDLLGLEVSVQQDPQEFGKFFMAKVEECVGDDAFVADVFRGRQTYETTCSECHNVTARAADFDELEVALRGQSSVGDCVPRHRATPDLADTGRCALEARGRQPVPLRAVRQKGRRRAPAEDRQGAPGAPGPIIALRLRPRHLGEEEAPRRHRDDRVHQDRRGRRERGLRPLRARAPSGRVGPRCGLSVENDHMRVAPRE